MSTAPMQFERFRDKYGRTAYRVLEGRERVGGIVRLPKTTFPKPTYLVNDYRVTRPLRAAGAPGDAGIQYVGSLAEARALFTESEVQR